MRGETTLYPGGLSTWEAVTDNVTPVDKVLLDSIGYEFYIIEYTLGINVNKGFPDVAARLDDQESDISSNISDIQTNKDSIDAIETDYVEKSGGSFEGNIGFNYYNLEYGYVHEIYDSEKNEIVGIPVGVILMWSGTIANIPTGWAICDGNNGTPNLTGKFIVHADADAGGTYNPGDTGGSDTHTLTVDEMPEHTHIQNPHAHAEDGQYPAGKCPTGAYWNIVGNNNQTTGNATAVNQDTGGDGAHENRPPFFALAFIMKL